ncbi:MAG: hypothetical protein ACR5KV_08105 [Wolbachia sp.]
MSVTDVEQKKFELEECTPKSQKKISWTNETNWSNYVKEFWEMMNLKI